MQFSENTDQERVQVKRSRLIASAERRVPTLQETRQDAPNWFSVARLFAAGAEYDAALTYAEGALRLWPGYAPAYLEKLECLAALGRWQDIDQERQRGNGLKSGKAFLWYAQAAAHLGQIALAHHLLDEVAPKTKGYYSSVVQTIEEVIGEQ